MIFQIFMQNFEKKSVARNVNNLSLHSINSSLYVVFSIITMIQF